MTIRRSRQEDGDLSVHVLSHKSISNYKYEGLDVQAEKRFARRDFSFRTTVHSVRGNAHP